VPYSYGWSIVALTALIKLATFPLTKKQVRGLAWPAAGLLPHPALAAVGWRESGHLGSQQPGCLPHVTPTGLNLSSPPSFISS
jgi:hypothetical protein